MFSVISSFLDPSILTIRSTFKQCETDRPNSRSYNECRMLFSASAERDFAHTQASPVPFDNGTVAPPFMEPVGSSLCSHGPASGHYPEPVHLALLIVL